MSTLAGKVALVTGSARGIGRAIVERYASLGASVVVNYASDERRARETVEAIEQKGGRALPVQADVAKIADIDRLFGIALDLFGQLDIVVANAGVELVNVPVVKSPRKTSIGCSRLTLKERSLRSKGPHNMSLTMDASSTSVQATPPSPCRGTGYMARAKRRRSTL